MRLFVALNPPSEALAGLEAALAPLRPAWPELRWASQDRWHVTLAFLGEVAEQKLDELSVRLGRAASRHSALELAIGPGAAFPNTKRARVLISRITGGEPALAALTSLAMSVAAGARRAGAPPPDEDRKYQPHLTLARTRQPTDLAELVGTLACFRGSPWAATEIHLIRSHGGANHQYEELAAWPLGRRARGLRG
jgi:RNA 2',3'-cyclic 3'-phosphodiesterase